MTAASLSRVAVSLAALAIAATVAHGAEWTPAVRLSPPGEQAWFPDVATDVAGGVHVFWSHGNATPPRYDAVVYCAASPQGCVTMTDAQRRYGEDGNYLARPSAAVDRQGTIHLIWRRKLAICHTTATLPGSLRDSSWARLRRLGTGVISTIGIDPEGSLHVVWSEPIYGPRTDPCFACADIFYSRSDDGGQVWSPAINVSRTPGGSEKPHVAFGAGGRVYIAWEEGRDHYVGKGIPQSSMFSASADGGRTWSPPTTFRSPDDIPQSIALGVDYTGRVVVVWQQLTGEAIYFQTSDDHGQTWAPPAPVVGIRRRLLQNKLDGYEMAADAAGHLHLVVTGRRDGEDESNYVFHLEWDGRNWSAPTALYQTDGTPEWPRIAVGNGNELHAVWFERPKGSEWNSERGEYAVWYARGQSTAPAIAPIAWPPRKSIWLTLDPWLLVAQAVAAVATVAVVIGFARRRGW